MNKLLSYSVTVLLSYCKTSAQNVIVIIYDELYVTRRFLKLLKMLRLLDIQPLTPHDASNCISEEWLNFLHLGTIFIELF